jgi:ATP-dependent helicase/DNAse subunit B
VLCGTQRSERAAQLDALVCEHWGASLLIVPRRALADPRSDRLIQKAELPGAWGRRVLTFQDFAAHLLRGERRVVSLIGELERGLILEQAIDHVRNTGELDVLGRAGDTPGFRTHVLRCITQLKQSAIDPPTFRKSLLRKQREHWIDPVVAAVYEAYQDALIDAEAFDEVGLYWQASLLCEHGTPVGLDGIRVIALDGFDDFTPSEFRLVRAVAGHVNTLAFGFNMDPDMPSRQDLYTIPRGTLRRIHKAFPGVQPEVFEESPPSSHTAFAASQVFWRDPPVLPETLRANITLLPCKDGTHELEAIGRRVKQLLRDGTAPSDICVVYRYLTGVADSLRAVFAEFGIPITCPQRPALSECAVPRFVTGVLQAFQEWGVDEVLEVLTSPCFAPNGDQADSAAYPLLARLARITGGQRDWRNGLAHLTERLTQSDSPDMELLNSRVSDAGSVTATMKAWLEQVFLLEQNWPHKATLSAYAECLDRMLDQLGVESAVAGWVEQESAAQELDALQVLRALLNRMHGWTAGGAALSRQEFLATLRAACRDASVGTENEPDGVRCFDAETARYFEFPYVFFAGLNEGEVPAPPHRSAIYSDEDIDDFARIDVVLDDKRKHSDRERLLFAHVLGVAQQELTMSWRSMTGDGKPLLPSPFMADVRELFVDLGLEPMEVDAAPIFTAVASPRELRNAVALRCGDSDALTSNFPEVAHGLTIEMARYDHKPFGVYDGALNDMAVLDALQDDFGDEHAFSVNQLETYARCPFRFFVERVLNVRDVEAPTGAVDRRDRGSMLHNALQAFHAHYRGRSVATIPGTEARDTMRTALDGAVVRQARRMHGVPKAVLEGEAERLWVLLQRYLDIERELDEQEWGPAHFEVSFGSVPGEAGDSLSVPEPYVLETDAGPIRFSGRIDRVDCSARGARIVDYKTGALPNVGDIKEGRSLQLSLYALALEQHLLTGSSCDEALFLRVGSTERREVMQRGVVQKGETEETWMRREEVARTAISRYVTGIRMGQFPPDSPGGHCVGCSHRRVCRYEEGRIQRKREATP